MASERAALLHAPNAVRGSAAIYGFAIAAAALLASVAMLGISRGTAAPIAREQVIVRPAQMLAGLGPYDNARKSRRTLALETYLNQVRL